MKKFLYPHCISTGAIFALILTLTACEKITQTISPDEEKTLKTDGVISRYHTLLSEPYSHPLSQQGYLIGIEKAPRGAVGFAHDSEVEFSRRVDLTRLEIPQPAEGLSEKDLKKQRTRFQKILKDPKVMFVSHILRYAPSPNSNGMKTELAHSTYQKTAFSDSAPNFTAPKNAYEVGWDAIDQLENRLLDDVYSARARGKPFSHFLVLSMGWNNDQIESIQRYNALISQTRRAAEARGENFNPLVIALTWPSVWGGTSVIDLANRALHLGSYPVKVNDADEIGFGIANHIINAMLPRLSNQTNVKIVAVGHSMGARILTRAYYSRDLLRNQGPKPAQAPVLIGLQGAFSANRFRENYDLLPIINLIFKGEGGPYQSHDRPTGQLVLTWSKGDKANLLARVVTGAAHVGGSQGAKIMRREDQLNKVENVVWGNLKIFRDGCLSSLEHDKVLFVDATSIILSHNDIRNKAVGEMIYEAVTCGGD